MAWRAEGLRLVPPRILEVTHTSPATIDLFTLHFFLISREINNDFLAETASIP